MGRIKKAAGPKHEATVSSAVAEFVVAASTLPISLLPRHLKTFPRRWPFPKGDLYHWIPLFNRFDAILDEFNTEYDLHDGPQVRPFGRALLLKGVAEESKVASVTPTNETELDTLGFGLQGDRELVEVILEFSRRLLENCGNRSLYSSSERLGDLLNTTDLSLLTTTLQLAVRLAQRYHASRQRGNNASQSLNNALLASHYNIDLEKVQKLANPFTKQPSPIQAPAAVSSPSTKGKEKSQNSQSQSKTSTNISPNDLLALITPDAKASINGSAKHAQKAERKDMNASHWETWGSVLLTYYQPATVPKEDTKQPPTPTPTRRPSGLSRPSRLSSSDESTDSPLASTNVKPDDPSSEGMKQVEIPYAAIASSSLEDILKENLEFLPKDSHYELLTRLRNAHAIATSLTTRQQLVGIRLLAITNLAYIYTDATFQQKILQQDSDQPRRLQLAYQLADLVHPPGNGASGIPYRLQTQALTALEALVKQKTKAADVGTALNIHVNHGVLFYILRKAVAEMATEESDDEAIELAKEERQEALFSLLEALPTSTARTVESLIAAGLLEILVEVLNLRTQKAERSHPKVLTFLNNFIYSSRDAMQSLANSKGLEAISDLLDYEVRSSLERAQNGEGLPEGFRTRVIDYQIPYFQQQSLKMLFKLIAHMMTNGTGNLDRLLRNLIDSPQLLNGLRTVIVNPKLFGSSVWGSAINIMSTFIHNEPTSYAVISEAGLSKGLLEAIGLRSAPEDPMKLYLNYIKEKDVFAPGLANPSASSIAKFMQEGHCASLRRVDLSQTRHEIPPASESILAVPQAFGAICLNRAGMAMFLESGALDSFFKIFESDDHIKSMAADRADLPRLLGSSFDELVRHHPTLKMPVMIAIMTMIERLGVHCETVANEKGYGSKLWLEAEDDKLIPAGDDNLSERDTMQDSRPEDDNDLIMGEASPLEHENLSAAVVRHEVPVSVEAIEIDERGASSTASRMGVAMHFLSGFFENPSLCSFFIEAGGVDYILSLATTPSLQYDFNIQDASGHLARVVHIMVEQKPHLVLPSLLQRAQEAADTLGPLYSYTGEDGFFSEFTTPESKRPKGPTVNSHAPIGTTMVKSLVNVLTLCNVLFEVFSSPIFTSRANHTPFSQVNLADMYRNLIKSLSLLHRVCVWEEILLQNRIPDAWKQATKMKGIGMGSDEADEVFGFLHNSEPAPPGGPPRLIPNSSASGTTNESTPKALAAPTTRDEHTAAFKNVKVLRYLLSQVPSIIVLFSQNLGKALAPKRRPDAYARQNAYMVAEAMSDACLEQLSYEPPRRAASTKDRYAYWIVALTSISSLMIDGTPMDRSASQVLTLLLQAFKNGGGLEAIRELLNTLYEDVKSLSSRDRDMSEEEQVRAFSANAAIKMILAFYAQITMAKSITESAQTHAITSNERDRGSPTFFSAPQFLVELRMIVLPVVKSIWDSDFVDKAQEPIIKRLIDILRTILEGGEEQGAFKRGDELPTPRKAPLKVYNIHTDKVRELKELGYDSEIAREALYRCMNATPSAREYCQSLEYSGAARYPIPDYDQEKSRESATQTPRHSDAGATVPNTDNAPSAAENTGPQPDFTEEMVAILTQARNSTGALNQALVQDVLSRTTQSEADGPTLRQSESNAEVEEASGQGFTSSLRPAPSLTPGVPPEADGDAGEEMVMSIDNIQSLNFDLPVPPHQTETMHRITVPSGGSNRLDGHNGQQGLQQVSPVTVDDLDDERSEIRKNLIDRALDVVNAHEYVTFELSDLINAAAMKASDAKTMRREIGETLVQSLISLQMDDDFRPAGKKIASYANLLALVIQDPSFYEATLVVLIENMEQFLGFIKIFPNQPPDEPSPWVGQILLVIEKMLAEDVQPAQMHAVPTDGKHLLNPILAHEPSLLSSDAKLQLFEAIVEILPRIGKDESLALSVVRTLVILTRNRIVASRLSEKRNIQRLFVMIKQLASMTNDRLPSTFMLLLRHIVEDDDTIRQIMRSEIIARFETRPGRLTSTTDYVKSMYDLVLRSPRIFVEVTNEKLEISRYDSTQRPQNLQLKAEPKAETKELKPAAESDAMNQESTSAGAVEDQSIDETKSPINEHREPLIQKPKVTEIKAPVVEHPSGVIHYLLSELLSYKDVEDKDPTMTTKEIMAEVTTPTPPDHQIIGETTNATSLSTTPSPAPADFSENKKVEKPEFKIEQHPIHFYRCFILKCLTELLHCYNRTKIEFINFSRKADPKAMTPSKPRSGVLHYLLGDVIPVGTLNHEETVAYRKKNTTSNWAMSAIVSLCLRTNENGYNKKQGSIDEDDEPDLLFVRKFVLEHALKAYKDANSSEEHADVKYSRLLDIADLFNRLLQGKIVPPIGTPAPGTDGNFQKSIAKLMFEKNFITALTSSIADIDLNFPGSKRAIKYILRPLKQLTSTAVTLSQDSDISTTPGQTDDDEISTATSVSDLGEEREETPDLFRNSTLGMFEPGREEESSSDSSEGDDEMYDDEYDEGIEYEEGLERDGDEVISDEDEELGEAGHLEGIPGDAGMDVEVVIDGDDDEPSDDEDDEDQDDSEDMDDDNEIEVIDEINGDSENASLAEGEDDGWQDEDGDDIERYNEEDGFDNDLSRDPDTESAVRDIVREFGGPEAALERLQAMDDGPSDLQMDIDSGRFMDDVVHRDEEDDDDDDDDGGEEDIDDEDVIYQPEYDDEEPGMPEPPFGWDPEDELGPPRHHHHHHHHHPRRTADPWSSSFTADILSDRHMPLYRSHRPAGVSRPNDDNMNPLLQRQDRSSASRPSRALRAAGLSDSSVSVNDYWVHGMDSIRRPRGIMPGESPLSFLNNIIASVDQSGGFGFSAMGGPNGAVHLHIAGGPGGGLSLPRELQIALGVPRHAHQEQIRLDREEHRQPAAFQPTITHQRWQEEARLLYGSLYWEKASRVINTLLHVLVPPAFEKKRLEEEEVKRMKEQAEKLKKEEQEAREKAEKEQQERERQEREAEAAREAELREQARAQEETQGNPQETGDTEDEGAMEGVESTQNETSVEAGDRGETIEAPASNEESAAAGPSEPAERVRTTIRGRELDITGLGIDLAYLDALPEDIREEVLMSQLAIQRSQAQAAGEEPTDISREFLEALPAEIREELLQQEAQDRRRREREEARRRTQAAGGGPARGAEDMDPASFLASLDPTLRQHVLMDQDEEMLAHLPEEIAAEARALGGERGMHRFPGIGRGGRSSGLVRHLLDGSRPPPPAIEKPPRRQIVQMLDKAGVATLLRLMFVPQQGSSRQSLNGILHDVSKNRQNRAEVISLLLSILQDGSADVNAVERSFAHLSLRAKQPNAQKTPQPLKRTLTGSIASTINNMEATPLMVIQQCLSALVTLTHYNPHIPSFFLTEHEVSSGMKTKANRKGKGKEKETRASKFALNALLSLLDRKLIMESSSCMEQLSSLLQSVTHPLTILLRKDKDTEAEKLEEPKAAPSTQPEGTTAPDAAASEQPPQEADRQAEAAAEESTSPMVDVQADTSTEQRRPAPTADPGNTEEAKKSTEENKSGDEEKKKVRTLTPPVVPEENLRLVVNILAARECSAKTFRDTLSTINNLSGIPGAKEVFGKGLIEQAQDLGQSILQDLDDLVSQIKQAESGTDIQGMALAKFSPASSDQAKLLRVLTALDYLFDPKRNGGKTKPAAENEGHSAESSTSKEDILTTLYENATFGSLWSKLSECLGSIDQAEGMLNIATILLPLVEALMVVCKNTTLKDIPLTKAAKEFAITSPPPESYMENLFFKFTEDHRKILNELVRHNPKLMSGTFSLLVKNPKVLEFDNKRNYFTRRLHSRGTEARHPQPPLQLSVRRDQVFLDSFKFLSFKSGDEIKYGKLSIRFHGEEGVDAGGVTREWFQVLSRQMFNPDYALFNPVSSDRTTFHPNRLSKVNDEHLMFFKFIGRIIGKALYEGRALDCHFSRAVYKRILGKTVSIKDMETVDVEYYKSLLWMLDNDITGALDETFSVTTDDFGVTEVVDLVENGRNIPVTEENKQEYVQRVVEHRLTGSVQAQLEQFLKGFHDIVPPELISIFNEQELELLISGLPDIDVDDWKNHTEYHNYQASSPQIQWFWRAVRSFDKEERAKLLQFVTGTSKVPLNGFGELEGMNGFSRFNIHRDYGNKDRLPSSHTCFNQLDLPEYDSYETLRQQVYTAMTAGSEYFGFA